jgi:Right handed beta helix region
VTTTSPTSAGTTTGTTTTSTTSPTTTTTITTTTATTTTTPAPSPGWTTPACDLTLAPGAELGGPLNNTANQGKTICLPDGSYWLTQTQHVPGIKVYALHQYQAKIVGWIETYAAADEWHGVSIDNGGYRGLQVYADNFVFVDSSFTNSHNAGGFYLGSSTYGVAHNVLIARNKIFNVGRLPGGTGGDHPFYAADASGYITDNWLWGNIGFGVQFYPHAFGLSFSYNVVVGQQQADVIFASDATNDVASHNVFVSNATGFASYQQSGTGAAADHTWFWNVGSDYSGGGYAQGGGDGSGDPQFVDAASKNYNLKAGSPAAGYGPRVTLP